MTHTATGSDKDNWGRGPWQDESDRIHWVDEATGLDCLIVREPRGGHLCGYVGLPPNHPLHGVDYMDVEAPPDVHGGLTYAAACDEAGRICHDPADGRADDLWWLGFDCAHLGDASPGYGVLYGSAYRSLGAARDTYKAISYVRSECTSLAAQLAGRRQEDGR